MKRQFTRLAVATGLWYGLTGVFLFVEESSGICNVTKFLNKAECLAGGFRWGARARRIGFNSVCMQTSCGET